MPFRKDETTWLDLIAAIDLCLENNINFGDEQNPNAPPNIVAHHCVDIESPDELTEREYKIIKSFILPRLDAFQCAECSTKIHHTELSTWFDFDQRCAACAHRTQKIRD